MRSINYKNSRRELTRHEKLQEELKVAIDAFNKAVAEINRIQAAQAGKERE